MPVRYRCYSDTRCDYHVYHDSKHDKYDKYDVSDTIAYHYRCAHHHRHCLDVYNSTRNNKDNNTSPSNNNATGDHAN